MQDKIAEKAVFYDLLINTLTRKEVLAICDNFLNSEKPNTIFFLNAHCFNIAQKDHVYRAALENTDLLLNDGVGVKLASYLTRIRFSENLNGTDLIPQILELAALRDKKVFFLGAKNGVAEKAASCATASLPGLNVVGCESGYFDSKKEKKIIHDINDSRADILILAMGVPRQEIWAETNKAHLQHVKIIVAGGAILDFLSKEVTRAPVWIRKIGMEWLYRMYLEPKRMWKRNLGNFRFFIYLITLKLSSARVTRSATKSSSGS